MDKHWTVYNLLPRLGILVRTGMSGKSMCIMRTFQLVLLILWAMGGLVSCKQQDIDANATASTFANNLTDISNYAISKGISGSTTASGLYFSLTKANSTSALAIYQDELEFTYTLYVLSGPSNTTVTSTSATNSTVVTDKKVDTTYAVNSTFVPFFQGVLKAGLEEGLLKMHEGESAVLLVPSKLSFGNVASSDGLIPANSPVRYDVALRRARTETQRLDEYAVTTGLSFSTVSSGTYAGLRIARTKVNAAGDTVATMLQKGQVVSIRYVAKQLHAGTAVGIDSTGTSTIQYNPATFISGFNGAIASMHVGESTTILVPSSLGYGSLGLVVGETDKTYKIPPYTPLRYDITVVSAK